jgi:hypothetical protein
VPPAGTAVSVAGNAVPVAGNAVSVLLALPRYPRREFFVGFKVPASGFPVGTHLVKVLVVALIADVPFPQFGGPLPVFRHDFVIIGIRVFVHTSSNVKLFIVSGVTSKGAHNPYFSLYSRTFRYGEKPK